MSDRIIPITGASWPFVNIQSLSEDGVFTFAWLDADHKQVDSGGSVGRLPDNQETTDENIAAAILNPPVPDVAPHRVLKDTIIQRVKTAGKLAQLRAMIETLDADQRFEWDNSSWFHSNNAVLVDGITSLELDSLVILAPDPLAP